jgi:hypothetical protein
MSAWWKEKRRRGHIFLMRPQRNGPRNAGFVRSVLRLMLDRWAP